MPGTTRLYGWLIACVFMAYPCTVTAQSNGPAAGTAWKEPVTGMEFVWVPGGCYEMGCGNWTSECSRDEKPVHEVCVDGFWMGKTEVTQGQWKKVMGNNPSYFKGKGDNYPVEQVGWNDGKRFAEKLTAIKNGTFTFRLATEAEWEYACRSGGKPEKYAGGSDLDKMSWYFRNSNRSTHAVATKAPNGLGLFDMSGNVFEWCEDSYHPANYSSHQRNNPMYADERGYQVLRGGSWNRVERSSRCATRGRVIATNLSRSIGFRVVRKK